MKKFPKSRIGLEELGRYVIAEPWPFMVDLERSHGMFLATIDGPELFDWAGYYGSKLIAHNHPKMYDPEFQRKLGRAAVNKMANPDFLTQECLDYYALLYRVAPKVMQNEKLEVYAVNSGAEAVENMLKYLLNRYNHRRAKEGKPHNDTRRFLHYDESFHGRTIYALGITELTHDDVMVKDFRGLYKNNMKIPFPYHVEGEHEGNQARMDESLGIVREIFEEEAENIVAVIVEPIQGAGGQRCAPEGYFKRLSELCHEFGVQLGFDEVQTAGGQTGTIFMVDQLDLPYPPDAVATGKKFGNGVVYMLESMPDIGVLDSTWGGTLADMVRVVREFEIVEEEKLIEQVPTKSKHLREVLQRLADQYSDLIYNVRGKGLYLGFSLRDPAAKGRLVSAAIEQEDLLLLGAGKDSIRMRPHLHVTHEDIDELEKRLDPVLRSMS